jgi:hypothetical protein
MVVGAVAFPVNARIQAAYRSGIQRSNGCRASYRPYQSETHPQPTGMGRIARNDEDENLNASLFGSDER